MGNTVLLGTSAADITPQRPIPLSGFGFRTGNFDSMLLDLSMFNLSRRLRRRDDELHSHRRQLHEGGYEAYEAMFYLMQPAPFAQPTEAILKEKIKNFITGRKLT